MKTRELLSTEQAYALLRRKVKREHGILHGSPLKDLPYLEPSESSSLHVDDGTGTKMEDGAVICGTLIPEQAIYYATVHRRLGNAGIRGSAIKGKRDGHGTIVGYDYFLSDEAKEFILRRDSLGTPYEGAVYWTSRKHFTYEQDEWQAASRVLEPASIAVNALQLSFDLRELRPPESDPTIQRYHAMFPPSG